MKKIFFALMVLLLASCSTTSNISVNENGEEQKPLTLKSKIQLMIGEEQENAIKNLPSSLVDDKNVEIFKSDLNSTGKISNLEKNRAGAGFARVYEGLSEDEITPIYMTVFLANYNDYSLDTNEEALENMMAKLVEEVTETQIFTNVKIEKQENKPIVWAGKKYKTFETQFSFKKAGDSKKGFLLLAINPEMMSYVRAQINCPKKGCVNVERKRRVIMARLLKSLDDYSLRLGTN
ncbi:MAG: hypothetical protein MJ247_05220 [Alphaproteobacteria bacterium]|nr:hypothetical protein [Alphaproteobacteria bacterium]